MTVAIILFGFVGMLVGLKLKVYALVPATLAAGLATFGYCLAQGESLFNAIFATLASLVAVQIGYLSWTFAAAMKETASPELAHGKSDIPSAARRGLLSDR